MLQNLGGDRTEGGFLQEKSFLRGLEGQVRFRMEVGNSYRKGGTKVGTEGWENSTRRLSAGSGRGGPGEQRASEGGALTPRLAV